MTEQAYIDATNLSKLKVAYLILRSMDNINGFDEKLFRTARRNLDMVIVQLSDCIEIKEE